MKFFRARPFCSSTAQTELLFWKIQQDFFFQWQLLHWTPSAELALQRNTWDSPRPRCASWLAQVFVYKMEMFPHKGCNATWCSGCPLSQAKIKLSAKKEDRQHTTALAEQQGSRAYIPTCKGIGSRGGDICSSDRYLKAGHLCHDRRLRFQIIKDSPSSEERGEGGRKM